jgi:hypothetical protein
VATARGPSQTESTSTNHLLALLIRRELLDLESGISFQLGLWDFLWGNEIERGYVASLDDEQREVALEQIRGNSADVMTLAGLYWGAAATEQQANESRTRLRDTLKRLAVAPLFGLDATLASAAIEEIADDLSPLLDIAQIVLDLAEETTEAELLEALAAVAAPGARGHLDHAVVMRAGRQERVSLVVIEGGEGEFGPESAKRAFEEWTRLEPHLEYYRVDHPASRSVAVLDRVSRECWWARKAQGDLVDLGEILPSAEPWRTVLYEVLDSGTRLSKKLA